MAVLAFCGNYLSLDLFGTVSLVFGSIFTLITLQMVGLPLALVVAGVGTSYTLFAWGHPYAILIFGAEVAFVALLSRRMSNLALADALYWVTVGFPLVLITYSGLMDISLSSAAFIGLKQAVNGILNSVVAGLAVGFLPTLFPVLRQHLPKVSFDALLFHILAFVALTTSLALTVAESRTDYRRHVGQLAAFLEAVGLQSRESVASGSIGEETLLVSLSPMLGITTGVVPLASHLSIAAVDSQGGYSDLLGRTRSLEATGRSVQVAGGLWRWSPEGAMPELLRSNASVYFVTLGGRPGEDDLRVELSAEPVIEALEASGRRNLLLLAGAMVFVLLASKFFVRLLTQPLIRLASATEGLPRLIASQGLAPDLPPSSVLEYDRLARSFQEMAVELRHIFRERDDLNRTLEARVEERTRQLGLLSQLARQTTNGVVVTDLEGRVTWANEAFEAMTGYTLAEMAGQVPGRILQRERPSSDVIRKMQQGLLNRCSFHVELLNHAKDGRPYWIELRCNPLVDESGEPVGFIAIENDITERVNIQRALQESHERLQLATEVAEMGIWAVDVETGQIEWNERNRRLHGIEADRDVATAWLERVHPEDADRVNALFGDLMQGKANTTRFEFRLNHPDRGPRVLSSIARAVRERDRVIRITGVTRDITHERQASDQLRRAAQHTEAILNNVVDAIIAIDTEGRITSCNRAAERIFGYSAQQMIRKSISMLMPADHAAQHDRYIRSYLDGAPARMMGRVGKLEAVRANGEVFPIELAITEVEAGDGRFFMGIIRDVTEREQVERMQSEFLATVNHELRTPLTSIRGTLALLQNQVVGELDANGERIVAAALKNAEQLGRMVEEMLDLERMRQGRLEIRPAPQSVGELVVQSIELNRVLAETSDIRLVNEASDAPGAMIHVDGARVIQILTNYISNAVKFSERGQTVQIRSAVRDGRARVSVIDNGPGIPKDKHDILFQKFAQLDTSDSRRHRGAGLGLAINRELATRMGGTVGLISQEGSGSEFWVEFPCMAAGAMQAPVVDELEAHRV
ncbi:PAS domain S-box protein [Tabrizicola sp.]|uniref:PAS domain S-box protein n=1 Tax=Tabrizicola sp. TaxID=2005166 RepID=UPI0035B13BA7